jgi:hypothetical protein
MRTAVMQVLLGSAEGGGGAILVYIFGTDQEGS